MKSLPLLTCDEEDVFRVVIALVPERIGDESLSVRETGFDTDETSRYIYRVSFFAFIEMTFIEQK